MRFISLLTVLSLLCFFTGCKTSSPDYDLESNKITRTVPEATEQLANPFSMAGYELIKENGRLVLYMDVDYGYIAVGDKKTETLWISNPDVDYDELVVGDAMTEYKSQLLVTYSDRSGRTSTTNSVYGSVGESRMTYKKTADGVEVTFLFLPENFEITVAYELYGDAFSARILSERIKEPESIYITKISLLPYFGAADKEKSGYLFVPDGSGGVISYNNGKEGYRAYTQSIYGGDLSLSRSYASDKEQNAALPVFGAMTAQTGFLGIITQGDAASEIRAGVSGMNSSYNWIYATFQYHIQDNVSLVGQEGSTAKDIVVNAEKPTTQNDFEIRYCFTDGNSSNITALSSLYAGYLENDLDLKKREAAKPTIFIDFYGAIDKLQLNVIGYPTNKTVAVTSFERAKTILEEIRSFTDATVIVNYYGALKGGIGVGRIDSKTNLEKSLGGKAAFENLMAYANEQDIKIFLNYEIVKFSKSGNGFIPLFDAAKNIIGLTADYYAFDVASGVKDKKKSYNFLGVNGLLETAGKLALSDSPFGSKKSFSTLGDLLYTNVSDKTAGRITTRNAYDKALTDLKSAQGDLLLDSGNAYVLPYASYISNAAVSSSGSFLIDYEVPFYQMAVRDFVSLGVPAINMADNKDFYFLKAIESGTAMHYSFSGSDSDVYKDSDYTDFYATGTGYLSDLKSRWTAAEAGYKSTAASPIVSYERLERGVYKTTFASGVYVMVNYGEKAFEKDGNRVEALGFVYGGDIS